MEPQTDYEKAVQRVEEKMGFYVHLIAYILVNALLIIVNLIKTPDRLWFYWPLAGWGIGVALHAWRVFGSEGMSGFKQKMIEKELQNISQKNNSPE